MVLHQSACRTDSTRLDSFVCSGYIFPPFSQPVLGVVGKPCFWSVSGPPINTPCVCVCVHVHVGVVATTCFEPGFLDYRDAIQAVGTTLQGSIMFIIGIVLKRKLFDLVLTLAFVAEDPPTDGKSGILAIYSSILPGNCDAGGKWSISVRSSRRTW